MSGTEVITLLTLLLCAAEITFNHYLP